jgi:hypothetical protein
MKFNDNHEIFELSGQNENPRRQIIMLALRVHVKMSEMHMKLVEWHLAAYLL